MKQLALRISVLGLASAAILAAQVQIVGKFGRARVGGRDAVVHVLVAVPSSANPNEAAAEAVRRHGARPFTALESAEFTTTGLVWDVFSDGISANDHVLQNYNNAGAPVSGGQAALQNTHTTWGDVSGSSLDFDFGGSTSRCPSLVPECNPAQPLDGSNDVGWCDLGRAHPRFGVTIGVTWFTTEVDEADMCLNNNRSVAWSTSGGDIDVQTVLLHENGHVAGVGHSEFTSAVMFASYQGPRRSLHPDDGNAVSCLYPSNPGGISGTVSQTGAGAIAAASVVVNACQAQFDDITDASGSYQIGGLPAGTYDVTASAEGFEDGMRSATVSPGATTSGINFLLDSTPTGGGSCTLKPVGDSCNSDSECCSSKCKGRPGNKTCK